MSILQIDKSLADYWAQYRQEDHINLLAEISKSDVVLQAPVPVDEFFWWKQQAKSVEVRSAAA
jgi:hypothetical protein